VSYGASAELHRTNRRRIVAALSRCIDLGGYGESLEASADAIDAVLCAFAAIAVTERRLACPVPEGEIARTEGWIAVHDGRTSGTTADRSAFVEAVEKGAEAARSGDLVSHSEAVRLLESFGR
jgi:hypothetical protein